MSGPLVRSSYRAGRLYQQAIAARGLDELSWVAWPPPAGSKPAKPTRAEKKAARGAKRAQRRETFRNVKQAFSLTRKQDSRFLPYMIMAAVAAAAVVYVVIYLLTSSPYFGIVPAIAGGRGRRDAGVLPAGPELDVRARPRGSPARPAGCCSRICAVTGG